MGIKHLFSLSSHKVLIELAISITKTPPYLGVSRHVLVNFCIVTHQYLYFLTKTVFFLFACYL